MSLIYFGSRIILINNSSEYEVNMASLDQFSTRLIELLPRLMRECTRYESNYLSQGVITLQQYIALEILTQEGACKMKQLADSLLLKLSSTTGLVDRLVKQELVKRFRTEEDRRTVYVEISPKGKKIVRQIHEQKRKGVKSLFARLSTKDRSQYLDILEKLVGDLSLKNE